MKIAVIGGGAAGFFAAIRAAQVLPDAAVWIFESNPSPLSKVKISGGGRCNVTNACRDLEKFLSHYPRGAEELRGAFKRFDARDTVDWFQSRGVKLKDEADGRMFPVSDSSETIIDCLMSEVRKLGIKVISKSKVSAISVKESFFTLRIGRGQDEQKFDRVILTPGGGKTGHTIARELGHKIISAVPSLFTFNIDDPRLEGLSGLSVDKAALSLRCGEAEFSSDGPLLITHWGLSGPAILKLSAWAARELFENNYQATLKVNWLGEGKGRFREELLKLRDSNPKKKPRNTIPAGVPKRLWLKLLETLEIPDERSWAEIGKKTLNLLESELTAGNFQVSGKGVFKEEFVTCGGVDLSELNFETMESRIVPGLFLAGEILNIDGLTGGFNFQSAWTTGYLAGEGISVT